MEENITQRKTNTILINIVTGEEAVTGLAESLSAFIAPDGREAREFTFSVTHAGKTSADALKGADLVLFILGDTDDKSFKPLTGILKKHGSNYIKAVLVNSLEDTLKDVIASLEKALDSGFTLKDFVQINNMGIPVDKVRRHLNIFRNGIAKMALEKPAVLHDGIFPLPEKDAVEYAALFDRKKDGYKLKKFVPASGAASRMFKFLCEFMAGFNPENETINAYTNRKNDTALSVFLVGLDKFPFFGEILQVIKENPDYADWNKNLRYYNFIKTMLAKGQFDYANKPKGILPFHQYDDFIATPVYEHLKESVAYAGSNNQSHVHFTISEEHLDGFLDAIEAVKPAIEEESGIRINFSFSYQHKQTDTIAVDLNNRPFRDDKDNLVFRPGGHGALIENLNRLEADIVFIKNIDNVSHNNIKAISLYKKALGGILVELQEKVFNYLTALDAGNADDVLIAEIFSFAKERLAIDVLADASKYTTEYKIEYATQLLNRPIRVCGMVKNEGEPGGGPFWVKGDKGRITLQIVESSQIDLENKAQQAILAQSTHFNPVDLVCGLKNYKGESFNLNEFVDNSTGFIVYKNKHGKDVKSYELPGLWNGAMAGWITVFVEVPLETFNPVKTVNDLLKPAHQPQ